MISVEPGQTAWAYSHAWFNTGGKGLSTSVPAYQGVNEI
jgi:hypothetical protein